MKKAAQKLPVSLRRLVAEMPASPRKRWSAEDDAQLMRDYSDIAASELAKRYGLTVSQIYNRAHFLGLAKSQSFFSSLGKGKLCTAGAPHRFKKGHVPVNKGLRRPGWAPGRMAETQFKPGQRSGIAAKNWRPIGTILRDSDGYLRIKVREGKKGEPYGFGNTRIWPMLSRHNWGKVHGPVPAGHALIFKDGDHDHCDVDNLELITRAGLMARNTVHNLPKPLAEVIQLNGALKRKLRRLDEKHNDGSAESSVRDTGSVEGRREANGY